MPPSCVRRALGVAANSFSKVPASERCCHSAILLTLLHLGIRNTRLGPRASGLCHAGLLAQPCRQILSKQGKVPRATVDWDAALSCAALDVLFSLWTRGLYELV